MEKNTYVSTSRLNIYNAIYRLFSEMDYNLRITVGDITLRLYDFDMADPSIWDKGIMANESAYDLGCLAAEHLGPYTYAELFAGEFDIIQGITDLICKDFNI